MTYYQSYAPHLDLFAVNSYGDIVRLKQFWVSGNFTRPYILTEGGPNGEWEVPNDVNGVPDEPTDLAKQDQYTASWNALLSHPGVALGGTEFHYGMENDFGGVWLNTYIGGWRRLGYYALKRAWTGTSSPNTPPEISGMTIGSQTSVPAGGKLDVSVAVTDPNGDPIRYNLTYSPKYVTNSTGFDNVRFTQTSPGHFSAVAPATMGVWKVYVYAYDGHGNVGIEQRSFRVTAPPVAGTNLALQGTATASSFQPTGPNGPQPPSAAVDGNLATRWASEWTDDQWLTVDFGTPTTFDHVRLAWESAYASAYDIQTSDDGTTWRTVYSTTAGDGGFDDLPVAGTARYVRMKGVKRASGFGYSLWEFGIYRS